MSNNELNVNELKVISDSDSVLNQLTGKKAKQAMKKQMTTARASQKKDEVGLMHDTKTNRYFVPPGTVELPNGTIRVDR